MRIKHLKLRGAIGLRQYGEEIDIDFDLFEAGPVCLVGENGAGKSTILENCQPWPMLISRNGSLTHHFELKDSLKELEFEFSGHTYLSRTIIDGERGKLEAYLYRDDQPINDGKVPTYKELVDKLFGSPEIFFKSIFMGQNSERISTLTAGEKKQFFVGLLGLDRYERLTAGAKAHAETMEKDEAASRGKLSQLEDQIAFNAIKLLDRQNIEKEISESQTGILRHERLIDQVSAQLKDAEKAAEEQRRLKDKIITFEADISSLRFDLASLETKKGRAIDKIAGEITKCEAEVKLLQRYMANGDEIRQKAARLETLILEESNYTKTRSALQEVKFKKGSLEVKVNSRYNEAKAQVQWVKDSIARGTKSAEALRIVPCKDTPQFVGTCPLIANAREADEELVHDRNRLDAAEKELDQALPQNNAELAALNGQIEAFRYDEAAHRCITSELNELRAGNWPKLLADLDRAEVTMDERRKQLEMFSAQKKEQEIELERESGEAYHKVELRAKEIEALKGKFSSEVEARVNELISKKSLYEKELGGLRTSLGSAQGRLAALCQLETENASLRKESEELEGKLKASASDISDWRLLENAFGKNGLQALELDAAGPSISGIATEIIQEFGKEWSISIRTVRASADKKKDVETFEIIVSTPQGIRNFDDLSGGERVWVEESLRKAVTIYLIRNSGRDYRTLFQDEADGALDPERAKAFLDTAFRAHKLTGAHHTIIITQRPEIWQRIPQRIHLDPEKHEITVVQGE